jgi:hypothetical protein
MYAQVGTVTQVKEPEDHHDAVHHSVCHGWYDRVILVLVPSFSSVVCCLLEYTCGSVVVCVSENTQVSGSVVDCSEYDNGGSCCACVVIW